ncbi:MAG: hypothetical protein Q7J64_02795 [Elusimicrobiota bacterium]|nr:hypothetical protein [Elusimicrobiota bacterium]
MLVSAMHDLEMLGDDQGPVDVIDTPIAQELEEEARASRGFDITSPGMMPTR